MKNEKMQSRKRSTSSFLQSKIDIVKNTNDSGEIKRRRAEASVDSDFELYILNPQKILEKFYLDAAQTPNLLQVSSNEHYQGKVYEEIFDAEELTNTKEESWTCDEQRDFEQLCNNLKGKKNMIEVLKKHFPNKNPNEIVYNYYIFYQPNSRLKSKSAPL